MLWNRFERREPFVVAQALPHLHRVLLRGLSRIQLPEFVESIDTRFDTER
jgi:hypothetical protein